ncbi:MAG: sulfotransferase family 2 domain-containing protein [Candidatus Aegiribacteria sp.]
MSRNARQLLSGGYANPGTRIAFVHVPKCGGSSLTVALKTAIGFHVQIPGRSSAALAHEAASRTAEILDRDYNRLCADLLLYYLADRRLRFIAGHWPVRDAAFEEFSEEWDFVLLLRHPVRRWLSNYFFNRYKTSDHYRIDRELNEFLNTSRARWYGCAYAAYLAPDDFAYGDDPAEAPLDKALASLQRFRIVGTLEHLDSMAESFRRIYGARLNTPHANLNPRGKAYARGM